jgi:hypothetical protein
MSLCAEKCVTRSVLFWGVTQRRIVILYCTSSIFKGQEVDLDFLNLEDGTDMLSLNIGKGLPSNAA